MLMNMAGTVGKFMQEIGLYEILQRAFGSVQQMMSVRKEVSPKCPGSADGCRNPSYQTHRIPRNA